MLYNGFDYEHQCWVLRGVIQCCGHLDDCNCYGKKHAGEAWGAELLKTEKIQLWHNGIMMTVIPLEEAKEKVRRGTAVVVNGQSITTQSQGGTR